MLNEEQLLQAVSGVRPEDILAAGQALGYLPRAPRRHCWRPLLIAAVLTVLMAATAVAAGLLGRAERLAPMPPDESGEARQAEIPNGFRGTPTYQGSARWWEFQADWELAHAGEQPDYSFPFIEGDLDRYLVCSLYEAYHREQADQLYEIAEEYDLQLYREALYLGMEQDTFYGLTGAQPFLSRQDLGFWGGYVLEDGSFSVEIRLPGDPGDIPCRLSRCYTGSIYPFGGAGKLRPYEETGYETSQGYPVLIDVFSPLEVEVTYCDPQGKTYITLTPNVPAEEDPLEIGRLAADQINFSALCERDTTQVLALLDKPTGAEKNPKAVEKLMRFQHSPAFRGAAEFQAFYEKTFYGICFTGTYGMEGCEDIDRQLEDLSQRYGLTYAKAKTRGNALSPKAIAFDNGSWQAPARGAQTLHYIPKNALYTMQNHFLQAGAYRRIWEYRTEEGQELVLCTQGPIHAPGAGGYALLETENAYLMLTFRNSSPLYMEQRVEQLDWTLFD